MNIEDSIIILKNIKKLVDIEWKHYVTDAELSAIKTLLTAYEKEKEKNSKLLEALDTVNHEKGVFIESYEKEKEKNKKAIDFINDNNNYFEDGENWQNILKIKEILEE